MSSIIELPPIGNIPKNFQTKNPSDGIQTEHLAVAARSLKPGELEQVKAQLGVVTFDAQMNAGLAAIGLDAEAIGISRIDRGGLIVAQQAILKTMTECSRIMESAKTPSGKLKAAAMVEKLARAMAAVSQSSSVGQVATSIADDGKVRRASPAKGAPMGPRPLPPVVTVNTETTSG